MKNRIYILFFLTLQASLYSQGSIDSLKTDSIKHSSHRKHSHRPDLFSEKLSITQTSGTLGKGILNFGGSVRFGNIYNHSASNPLNDAAHRGFGLDQLSDIRWSVNYGITDRLMIGIGRSRYHEMFDGSVKWQILRQNPEKNMPFTWSLFLDMGYTSMTTKKLYSGTIKPPTNEADRFQYLSQFIISRKFNDRLFLEILPTYLHRNFIKRYINSSNGKEDQNDLFSLGIGGKFRVTKRISLVADFYYNFSKFQQNNPSGYYMPFALGVEIISHGRFIHLDFTNATAILESSMLTNTRNAWSKGQIKLGFNLNRSIRL